MSSPFGRADHHRENPYGSGHFSDAAQAKIVTQGRGPIARTVDQIYRFNPAEPSIVFGGAGSGKGATIGAYQPGHPSMGSFFLLDMGGQYLSTTFHWNLAEKREVFVINPEGASSYPDLNVPFHLLGILKNDDFLFDNARRVAGMALKDDAKGDNAWVGSSARRWLTRLLILLVLLEGRVTPKRLWRVINEIDSDDDAAKAWGRASKDLPYEIYATLAEMYRKKQNSEKEYGAIMGKIKDDLDWLSSPIVADSVSGDDDVLSYLPDPKRKIGIYFALKSGSGKMMESLTRMVTGIAMLHCMRSVQGALPCFYLEEAATLGRADFVKQAVSECRKYFHTVLVYQSLGQLNTLFGQNGAQELLDSCGQQIFLGGGVRDYSSALKLANTIGKTTITLDDPAQQRERAYRAEKAMRDEILHGGDPLAAAEQHQHYINQSHQGRYISRFVIDPAEIMRLKNEVIILSPGAGVAPVLAQKMPNYWNNPAMAGRFAPDPLFPPLDRVKIKRKILFGYQTRDFIRTDVPDHLAHWPNHCNGQIAYVQDYRTW